MSNTSFPGLHTLSTAVDGVLKPVLKQHGFTESRIIADWSMVVGEVNAQLCLPTKLMFPKGQRREGVLHVSVQSGFALTLQHLEPMVIEKINTYFGYPAVARLQLHQTMLLKPTKKAPPKPAPLTAEECQALVNTTQDIEDTDLATALQSLGEAVMQAHKKKEKNSSS